MTYPSMGAASQMALDTTSSFSSASKALEFNSESLVRQGAILETEGIRGTRSHAGERTRTGPSKCSGPIELDVDAGLLDTLLPFILGAGPASSVYSLAEILPSFYLMIDRGAKVFTYSGCFVNRATFRASAADPRLKLRIEVEAETESVANAGSFPGGVSADVRRPYIFADGAWTIGGGTYSSFDWELTIDNHLQADRFVNELTRSQIPAVDRTVTCRLTTPWTSTETALYGLGVGSFGSASMIFTNAEESGSVLTFGMPLLQFPSQSPAVLRKQNEIKQTIAGIARKSGSTAELSITNAHA